MDNGPVRDRAHPSWRASVSILLLPSRQNGCVLDRSSFPSSRPRWDYGTSNHGLSLPEEVLVHTDCLRYRECGRKSELPPLVPPARFAVHNLQHRGICSSGEQRRVHNVHSRFHGRRTEESCEFTAPKPAFALLPNWSGDLSGCVPPPSTPANPRAVSRYSCAKKSFALRSTFLSRSDRIHFDRIGSVAGGVPSPSFH